MSDRCQCCGARWNLGDNQWVSVKDQPPPLKCLAVFRSEPDVQYSLAAHGWFRDTIYACRYENGKFIIQSHGPILPATHWMPLPDLPAHEIRIQKIEWEGSLRAMTSDGRNINIAEELNRNNES